MRLFIKNVRQQAYWKRLEGAQQSVGRSTRRFSSQCRWRASCSEKWGVKFHDDNFNQRSGIYRKLADVVFTEVQTKEDGLWAQLAHLAEILELPPHLAKQADKAAKTAAYFVRCRDLLAGTEKLDIKQLNDLFGYDYEDSLSMRKQVFQAHFNLKFDEISSAQRYTPEEEAALRADCATLDIPYELKNNIVSALENTAAFGMRKTVL